MICCGVTYFFDFRHRLSVRKSDLSTGSHEIRHTQALKFLLSETSTTPDALN
jgi:hypothetical protein